jgi:hypothetical protein
MGMFSWLDSQTNESIANIHSGKKIRTVYLLQPNGKKPIAEHQYDGYGVFNTTDAHEWLAQENYGIEDRLLGTFLEWGSFFEDSQSYYACGMHTTLEHLELLVNDKNKRIVIFDTYESVIRDGMTVNDMIERKLIANREVSCKYPLKFSFTPNTIYEEVEAAKPCPHQGFFYN